jgi:SAM-dependent methyltransferase
MLSIYESTDYFEGTGHGYYSYAEQEPALRATFRRLLSNLKKRGLTGGALLDVGCGYGYLLDEARNLFSLRVGTEFSPQAANHALAIADEVYVGGVEQIPPAAQFDCITAAQVIEHVYDPRSFVARLSTHLKAGGKIVIATPNMGSVWRRLLGARWPSFKVPEHVTFFDQKSLTRLMGFASLKDITLLPYPHAFPLAVISRHLSLPLPRAISNVIVWIPATTIAMYGRAAATDGDVV